MATHLTEIRESYVLPRRFVGGHQGITDIEIWKVRACAFVAMQHVALLGSILGSTSFTTVRGN